MEYNQKEQVGVICEIKYKGVMMFMKIGFKLILKCSETLQIKMILTTSLFGGFNLEY